MIQHSEVPYRLVPYRKSQTNIHVVTLVFKRVRKSGKRRLETFILPKGWVRLKYL